MKTLKERVCAIAYVSGVLAALLFFSCSDGGGSSGGSTAKSGSYTLTGDGQTHQLVEATQLSGAVSITLTFTASGTIADTDWISFYTDSNWGYDSTGSYTALASAPFGYPPEDGASVTISSSWDDWGYAVKYGIWVASSVAGTITYTIKTSSSDTSGWVSNSKVLSATETVTLSTGGTKTLLLSASDLADADTVTLTLTEYTQSSSTDWITLYYADDWAAVLTQGDGLFGYPPVQGTSCTLSSSLDNWDECLTGGIYYAASCTAATITCEIYEDASADNSSVTLNAIGATLDSDFMRGFDASMVSQLEECGATFSDTDGEEGDIFEILADHGVNWARLRIWVDPADDAQGDNDYDRTLAMAKRIKAAGLNFLLDFHYSDTWADPGSQHRPASWDDVTALGSAQDTSASTSSLCGTVYAYTYEVIKGLYDEGYAPDMVQLGNEINPGMLTTSSTGGSTSPSCGSGTSEAANLVAVLKAAAAAVDAVDSDIPKMIHLASSSGDNLQWWFNRMDGIDYDYIGLSYYPYYSHGTLANLRTYLAALKSKYNKEVLVVETSWGWDFDAWSDNTSNEFWYDDGVAAASNLVDSSNTMLEYLQTGTYNGEECIAASCQNQVTIFSAIMEAVATAGGCGVFYWGGEWIPDGDNEIADNWENQTLFDFDGVALPSIDMFKVQGSSAN